MSESAIFNHRRHQLHRMRAARSGEDFLLQEMAERLGDRLMDMNRKFPVALDLGAHHGILARYLPESAGITTLVQSEATMPLLKQCTGLKVQADNEYLPFADDSFDLIISCGSLQWVNDVPGLLVQVKRALTPDGLFLAMVPGGETLNELRTAFESAEMQSRGGISPRVSPFIDIRDAGALLQRAGFALPVVDSETVEVVYEHPFKLLHDLRGMGQTNALVSSHKGFTPCSLMMQMVDHYMQHFSRPDGRVSASFELVTMTAWKPHESQQQPLKRGSGKAHLTEVLK